MKYLYFLTACLLMVLCMSFVSSAKGDVTKGYTYESVVFTDGYLGFGTEVSLMKMKASYRYGYLQIDTKGVLAQELKVKSCSFISPKISNLQLYRKARDGITQNSVYNPKTYNLSAKVSG